MKALNKVIRFDKAGIVTKRGKKTICYEYVTQNQISPKHWNFTEMEITDRLFTGPDCYTWMKTFAWLPVKTIGGRYVWMQTVYKQRFWAVWGNGFHMEPEVEYATLFDMLKIKNV